MARKRPDTVLTSMMRQKIERGQLSRWLLFAISGFGAFWFSAGFVVIVVAKFIFEAELYADNGIFLMAPLIVAFSFTIASSLGRGDGRVVLNTLIFNMIAMLNFLVSLVGIGVYLGYVSTPYWDCLLDNTLSTVEFIICEEQGWVRHVLYWMIAASVFVAIAGFIATGYDAVSIWSKRYKKVTAPPEATEV